MKTVSVLICCHSTDHLHDRLLQRAFESLVNQTYDEFEVVIVLDECWEDTVEIVRKYKDVLDIRFFERPKKQGLAAAKNFGISKCSGDWIAFLDADDAYHEEKLEKQIDFMRENPAYDVIGTQAWDVYDVLTDAESVRENCFTLGQYKHHQHIIERLPQENVICHGSVMIKASVLKLIPYPTSKEFLGREDYTLWKTLAQMNFKFYNIPERLYYYSMGTGVAR